ncbi:carboxynorspermidine decarboxylase [delta proteobacterium NaphS2]|nr:carboxynorspermidine decarboxylase [delta proteobacterium NaphS2]
MDRNNPLGLDLEGVSTPCFVVDEGRLRQNLAVLKHVQDRTGCRILLALKAFAMFSVFPLLGKTLHGVCASSPHEARLGYEEFKGEVHTFAAAYSEAQMRKVMRYSNVVVFNSFSQWDRFRPFLQNASKDIRCGIRVNPEHSEGKVPLYDPCASGSRLGVRRSRFEGEDLTGISGLHFHTLCEHNVDALERTLRVFEEKFGSFLKGMTWVNFGGGHHITRPDYDVEQLCRLILDFKRRYSLQVYLEPGEAVALNAGILVATVLDIVQNDMPIAVLDTSVPCHMPDVLEMPYRPEVACTGLPQEKAYTYRLTGQSCLAGDVAGEYSFDRPLHLGQRLAFLDMAHYTMVKTNTFNGVALPDIALYDHRNDSVQVIRTFGYEDYRMRLS